MKIYTTEELKQGTPEWLAIRLGKFTASDAQAIAAKGAGLTTLCYAKVAERLTGQPSKEKYTNPDMERGNLLEELARNAYEIETGNTVLQVGFIEKSDTEGCSPDGLVDEDGMAEYKCPNPSNFVKYMVQRSIPSDHKLQMQFQMYIAERKWVDYGVFAENFPTPLIVTRVWRDEAVIEQIRIGLEEGYENIERIMAKL